MKSDDYRCNNQNSSKLQKPNLYPVQQLNTISSNGTFMKQNTYFLDILTECSLF